MRANVRKGKGQTLSREWCKGAIVKNFPAPRPGDLRYDLKENWVTEPFKLLEYPLHSGSPLGSAGRGGESSRHASSTTTTVPLSKIPIFQRFMFLFLKQSLILYPRLVLNSQSCLSLPSAENTSTRHHTYLLKSLYVQGLCLRSR